PRTVAAVPQDDRAATAQGWPSEADRRLDARWPLDRAWTFLGALDPWGPFVVETAGGPVVVHARLSRTRDEVLGAPRRAGPEATVALQFEGGVVRAR
ncbi:MAG TPA: hypothetical protein VFM29_00755, partial [Vicinamibacteria bacterium]|nr:hypothetical protein [Vicinamibacteria bacterium]